MTEGSEAFSSQHRVRDRIGVPDRFAAVAELVRWRGPLAQHARLPADVFASGLLGQGDQVIVHVACRDRNRNELLSLGWRLASARITEPKPEERAP